MDQNTDIQQLKDIIQKQHETIHDLQKTIVELQQKLLETSKAHVKFNTRRRDL
jgi:hypothetical protein